MGYCALADIRRLIEDRHIITLSNDDPAADKPNQPAVKAAIEQADRLIDSYAGLQRTVPLSPVPELVRTLSATLAVFFLYRRRGQVPEIWEQQYRNDCAVLQKIGEGKLVFGAPETGSEAPPERALTSSSAKTLGGSGGLLEGF